MNQNPEIWPHGVAYSVLKGSISTNKKIFIIYYRLEKGKKIEKMHVFFTFSPFLCQRHPLILLDFKKKLGILTITSWYPAFFHSLSKISREWNTLR